MQTNDLSPPIPSEAALAAARSKLALPATLIIASEVLGLVIQGASLLFRDPIRAFVESRLMQSGQKLPPGSMDSKPVLVAIAIAGSLFVIYAMLEMRKAQKFGVAVAGAILAMLPFGSLCCFFGLPLGIWALAVLFNSDVRAAFD